MTDWLHGFEVIQATHPGGDVADDGHAKGVLHTTEGTSIEGAVSAYRANTGWPLITCDPVTARKAQHYPLWTSQRGLEHPSGTVQTNRVVRCQIEVVAYAADSPDWPTGWKTWLGAEVIAPVSAALGIPLVCTVNFGGNEAYGTNGPYRLTNDDWLAYEGWLGHQHVPHNSHWDPGRLDIQAILAATGAHAQGTGPAPLPGTPTSGDLEMLDRNDPVVKDLFANLEFLRGTKPDSFGGEHTGTLQIAAGIGNLYRDSMANFTIVRALLAGLKFPSIDAKELAKALAPLLSEALPHLADADFARIAKDVNDEEARRLAA